MKKEYHVYIGWLIFAVAALRLIPYGNVISFPAIVYAAFRADEIRKQEDPSRGNKLIWASIGIFVILLILPSALGLLLV